MKVSRKIDVTKKEYEVLDKFFDMCNKIGSYNIDWHWQNSPYYHVTHWMPIPKLEEE